MEKESTIFGHFEDDDETMIDPCYSVMCQFELTTLTARNCGARAELTKNGMMHVSTLIYLNIYLHGLRTFF